MKGINYKPIGVIRLPYKESRKTPIQPVDDRGIKGRISTSKGDGSYEG